MWEVGKVRREETTENGRGRATGRKTVNVGRVKDGE
jgi:hypothetical protein